MQKHRRLWLFLFVTGFGIVFLDMVITTTSDGSEMIIGGWIYNQAGAFVTFMLYALPGLLGLTMLTSRGTNDIPMEIRKK
jgi:hypothetical protein